MNLQVSLISNLKCLILLFLVILMADKSFRFRFTYDLCNLFQKGLRELTRSWSLLIREPDFGVPQCVGSLKVKLRSSNLLNRRA